MKKSITTRAVERWKEEMPVEQEMVPKDKYTIFDRKEKKYRKSIRSKIQHGGAMICDVLLMIYRASQMDESITTSQPTGILIESWIIRARGV